MAPHQNEVTLFLPALFSIRLKPIIEKSFASELAIFAPKANPCEHPDERFSIMPVQVLNFTFDGSIREKVDCHEWDCPSALIATGIVLLSRR